MFRKIVCSYLFIGDTNFFFLFFFSLANKFNEMGKGRKGGGGKSGGEGREEGRKGGRGEDGWLEPEEWVKVGYILHE